MKVLVVKTNNLLPDKELEEVRQHILRQINAGGVIAIDSHYEIKTLEFDAVEVVDGANTE